MKKTKTGPKPLVRWYVQIRSETAQTALVEGGAEDQILGELTSMTVRCDNGDIDQRPVIEITEFMKDELISRGHEKGLTFTIFTQDGNEVPEFYYEQQTWPERMLFVPNNRRKGVIWASSLLRTNERRAKRFKAGRKAKKA